MIDKIDGAGGVRGTQATRETRRTTKPTATSGTSFVGHLDSGNASEGTLASGGVNTLGSISQLVGLQEVDDALARRKRGKHRAKDLLDKLDEIRVALLTGNIGKAQLMHLTHMVGQRRGDDGDPRLTELLDEIELRARVELAKLGY